MSEAPTNTKKFSKNAALERLQDLEFKKNKCRVDSRAAIDEEHKRETEGQRGRQQREKLEAEEKEKRFKESLRAEGIDVDRYMRLHETQEVEDAKRKKKSKRVSAGEIDIEGEEAHYRSYKKKRNKVAFDRDAYDAQKLTLGQDFYDTMTLPANGLQHKDDPMQVLALRDELEDTMARRAEFSRRRAYSEEGDVNFINEQNRKFSQKISRAYDPFTVEIRENLERGTAL